MYIKKSKIICNVIIRVISFEGGINMIQGLIVVLVATVLYSMNNLLGLITKFMIFGMMIFTIFSDVIKSWDSKLFAIVLLSLPVFINTGIKFLKAKSLKV